MKQELHNFFQGIANKNEAEFNQFHEKYHMLIYRIAFSILKNKEDSEDVEQKVFLKIWQIEQERLPTSNEASWLYAVTKNEALNYLKSQKQEIDIDDIYYITDEKQELNNVIDKDSYNRIIAKLNQQEQEIVSLKILSKMSFKEIAQVLKVPIGTVQWKYYQSLYTLRTILGSITIWLMAILGLQIGQTAKGGPVFPIGTKKNQEENLKDIENAGNESGMGESNKADTVIENNTLIDKDQIGESTVRNETMQPNTNPNVVTYSRGRLGVFWGITVICFIITIIFSIIFIKHQQNAKKKVSK